MSTLLKEFVSSLILEILEEDKFSDAVKQNPEIAQELEKYFKGTKPKYLPWIIKQLRAPGTDSQEITKLISDFDIFVQQNRIKEKDINKYETSLQLKWVIDNIKENPSKTQIKKKAKKDADVIYSDSEWLIIEPLSMEASCYYGYGTKWCISAKIKNAFQGYHKNGVRFIFVIDKKDNKKFAISLSPDEQPYVYDDNDNVVKVSDFATTNVSHNILNIINSKTKEIIGQDLYRDITVLDAINNPIEELKNIESFNRILPKMHHFHRMKVLIDVVKYFLEHDFSTVEKSENIRLSCKNIFEYEMNDLIPKDNSYEELLSLINAGPYLKLNLGFGNQSINILKYKILLKQQGIINPFISPGVLVFPFFFAKKEGLQEIALKTKQAIKNNNLPIDEKRKIITEFVTILAGGSQFFASNSDNNVRAYAFKAEENYKYNIFMDFDVHMGEENFSKNEQKDIEYLLYWINLYINSGYDLNSLIKL